MTLPRKTIRARRTQFLALLLLAALAFVIVVAAKFLVIDRDIVTTDNAFVTGNIIPVYSDATGVVADVLAEETQNVKKGDVIMRLDGQRAAAALAQAEADLGRAVRSVGALFAQRGQVCQKIASRQAIRDRTQHDLARYHAAVSSGSVSRQQVQNAEDQFSSLDADLREARAEYRAIDARIGGVTRLNHPDVESAKAKFADAFIEMARQNIRAPASGYLAKRRAQIGQRVKAGDPLVNIVPLDHLWVEANVWENRLARVRPGQKATIVVDLWGKGVAYRGTVEGLVPGSGSVFASLPPDNATGNFIRITQRVPVRIALDREEIAREPLRPGLSAVATIDVGDAKRTHNEPVTKIDAPEYRTDIYAQDAIEARVRADRVIHDNAIDGVDDTPPTRCLAVRAGD